MLGMLLIVYAGIAATVTIIVWIACGIAQATSNNSRELFEDIFFPPVVGVLWPVVLLAPLGWLFVSIGKLFGMLVRHNQEHQDN